MWASIRRKRFGGWLVNGGNLYLESGKRPVYSFCQPLTASRDKRIKYTKIIDFFIVYS